PDIGVEVHLAAHTEQNFFGMNIGRNARIAECANQDGIEVARQDGEAVGRDGGLIGEIAVDSPVERRQFESSTRGLHDFYSLRDDLFSDSIAGNHSYTPHFYCAHVRNVSTALNHSETCCVETGLVVQRRGLPRLSAGRDARSRVSTGKWLGARSGYSVRYNQGLNNQSLNIKD